MWQAPTLWVFDAERNDLLPPATTRAVGGLLEGQTANEHSFPRVVERTFENACGLRGDLDPREFSTPVDLHLNSGSPILTSCSHPGSHQRAAMEAGYESFVQDLRRSRDNFVEKSRIFGAKTTSKIDQAAKNEFRLVLFLINALCCKLQYSAFCDHSLVSANWAICWWEAVIISCSNTCISMLN